ncbi:MAG TPA: hypothetical protein VJB89_02050 [Candidatus Nanoarchaeia archaeon]|nr:hypothetical protein [Candidatus Nanoarchaeia archaeon]
MKKILLFILLLSFNIFYVEANYQENIISEFISIYWSLDNPNLYIYDNKTLEIINSFAQFKKLQNISNNSLIVNLDRDNISVSSEEKNHEKEKSCDNRTDKYWATNQDGLNTSINFSLKENYNLSKICFMQLDSTKDPLWNVTNISFNENSFLVNLSNSFIKENDEKIRPIECFNFTPIYAKNLQFNPISLYPGSKQNKLSAGMTEFYVYPLLYNETGIIKTKEIEINDLKQWNNYEISYIGWVNVDYSNDSGSNWYPIKDIINKTDKKIILKFTLVSDGLSESKLDEFQLRYEVKEIDQINPSVIELWPLLNSRFNISDRIEISANVTDDFLEKVLANLEFPNGSTQQLELINLSYSNKFNTSFLMPDLLGVFNITIIANDSSNNINQTEKINFTVIKFEENIENPPASIISGSNVGSSSGRLEESPSEGVILEPTQEIVIKKEEPIIENNQPSKAKELINLENNKKEIIPTGSIVRNINLFVGKGYGVWIISGLIIFGLGIKVLLIFLKNR